MDVGELTGNWDYASLPSNVRLGEGCYLEARNSFDRFRSQQDPGLVLGDRVRAYTWTAFTTEPEAVIRVGDDSTLVGAVFWCSRSITLGERVLVSYNVMIADSDFHPHDPDARQEDAVAVSPAGDRSQRPHFAREPVVIESDVRVGMGAIVLKGVRIGAGAEIGAGAVVASDIPPGALAIGNPARVVEPGGAGG